MITTEAIIDSLREARQEKLALVVLVGLMTDSLETSIERLETLIPTMQELKDGSRRVKYSRQKVVFPEVDHDVARRVCDIAQEILPWIKQVNALHEEDESEVIIGLS